MRPIIKENGVRKKGYKWWFGVITNKIEISIPKIILINNIGTPPISPKKYTLAIPA